MSLGMVSIGTCAFDPASGELVRDGRRIGLEDRAARTLELLCARRGEVVTRAEIIAQVWGGRQQSPNSVAVVISDLRRALGDDARAPIHIETVTKRGYRLRENQPRAAASPPRPPGAWIPPAIGAALIAMAALSWMSRTPDRPLARIEKVANATGSPAYQPLATAVEGLLLTDLQRQAHVRVIGPTSNSAKLHPKLIVRARLILWTSAPAVELSAIDTKSGLTTWSGLAEGPEAALPGQVAREMTGLAAWLNAGKL
jgi:DNA-binding winged helix-turn-helix (wHTH) protein